MEDYEKIVKEKGLPAVGQTSAQQEIRHPVAGHGETRGLE